MLPDDANARARAIRWRFAAFSTLEPPIVDREIATLLERDEAWYEQRLPIVEDRIRDRLGELSGRLGDADWLDGAFSAGDLLMVAVLRRLNGSDILHEYPNLSAYVARGEVGRPSGVLSMLNWRFSPPHRPADEGRSGPLDHSGANARF